MAAAQVPEARRVEVVCLQLQHVGKSPRESSLIPQSEQPGVYRAQGRPGGSPKPTETIESFFVLRGFVNSRFRLPRAVPEPPEETQERPKKRPRQPKRGQDSSKSHPEESQRPTGMAQDHLRDGPSGQRRPGIPRSLRGDKSNPK